MGAVNQAIVLKFDLSQIAPGSITDASLELTSVDGIVGNQWFDVFGLEQNSPGWNWSEQAIQFQNAPGFNFDGHSGTLGIDPSDPNVPDLLHLGSFSVSDVAAGGTITFDNANLAVFLNLVALRPRDGRRPSGHDYPGADQRGATSLVDFYSKESGSSSAPRLNITGLPATVPEPSTMLLSGPVAWPAGWPVRSSDAGCGAANTNPQRKQGAIGDAAFARYRTVLWRTIPRLRSGLERSLAAG